MDKYSPRNIRIRKSLDETFSLKKKANAILFGSLLGDGTIGRRGPNSYRLAIGHCLKQRQLVMYKFKYLCPLCRTTRGPFVETTYKKLKGNKDLKSYASLKFESTTCKFLGKYFHLFYKATQLPNGETKYVKMITRELLEALPKSPFVVAILFLDDGTVRSDAYSGKLALQCYSKYELLLFQKWLVDVHQLETVLLCSNVEKQQYYLSIPAKSFGKLAKMVELVVKDVPSMSYKLNEIRKGMSNFG